MTDEEISRIKAHIEIHARREFHAVEITEIMRKAVAELEHITELEKEKCELLGIIQGKDKAIASLKKENARLKATLNAVNLPTPELEKASKLRERQLAAKEIDETFDISVWC